MRAKWPGVGPRLVQRLKDLGYTSERTKTGADLQGFALKHAYPTQYMQKWANDLATPDRENLLRLTRDLGVRLEWLLVGEGPNPEPPKKGKK